MQSAEREGPLVHPAEPEDRDLGTHIEANPKEMADAAANVHAAVAGQIKLAGGVALILHGQEWWRKERGFALASMGVAGKDPTLVLAPDGEICGIRIMTEHNSGRVGTFLGEQLERTEARAPKVVESEELQTGKN